MRKIVFLFTAIAVLSACSKGNDEANNNMNNNVISPPAWIQGTWGLEDVSGEMFRFSYDDICLISVTASNCFKGSVRNGYMKVSSQKATNQTYEIILSDPNGAANNELFFKKISNNEIEWKSRGFGGVPITLVKRK